MDKRTMKLCCDNKSMVDTIKKVSKQLITLKQLHTPDMDVIIEILETEKKVMIMDTKYIYGM
jgi:hypothetical protein